MKCLCPQCGNEQTQKVSAIVESGTTSTKTEGYVGAVDPRKLGWLWGGSEKLVSSTATSRTRLANRFSPPPKAEGAGNYGCAVFLASCIIAAIIAAILGNKNPSESVKILAGFGCFLGGVVFPIIACVYGFIINYRYNTDIHPELQKEWDRAWYCHRCDTTFTVS